MDREIREKRRIRLEINGVLCGLITEESEEYMQSLAEEVGALMRSIQEASPYITREAAALTVALSYCDDAKKNGQQAFELRERVDELEVEAEIWQEDKAKMTSSDASGRNDELLEKLKKLEEENTALSQSASEMDELRSRSEELTDENEALRAEIVKMNDALTSAERPAPSAAAGASAAAVPTVRRERTKKNPLRFEDDMNKEGIVSFFEKN